MENQDQNEVADLYHKFFQPDRYICTYYSHLDKEVEFFLKNLHQFFNKEDLLCWESSSRRVLEIGSGPTVTSIISASRWSDNIVCAEFLESNRRLLQHFVSSDQTTDNLDVWDPFFRFLADLEHSRDVETLKRRLCRAVNCITPCDVLRTDPLGGTQHNLPREYDVIISTLCLEFAATSMEMYRAAIRNVASLLKPGGYIILQGALGNSYYLLDGQKFPSVSLDRLSIESAVLDAGLTPQTWTELQRCSEYQDKPADHSGCFCLVLRKIQQKP